VKGATVKITNLRTVIAGNSWNTYVQEICDEFNVEWEQRIATPPIRGLDGYIAIPGRPGLGLTLDLEEIAGHPCQQTAYLPLFRAGWERPDPNVAAETH
jgi:hypothetical protein